MCSLRGCVVKVFHCWHQGWPLLRKGVADSVHQHLMSVHHDLVAPFTGRLMARCERQPHLVLDVTQGQEFFHHSGTHLRTPIGSNNVRDLARPHYTRDQRARKVARLERSKGLQVRDMQFCTVVTEHVLLTRLGLGEGSLDVHNHIKPRKYGAHLIICEHGAQGRLHRVPAEASAYFAF